MLPDQPLLSPWRIIQAVFVYLWWMGVVTRFGGHPPSIANHFFYFRREQIRFRHDAGYFEGLPTILRYHWNDLKRGINVRIRHSH